MVLLLTLLKFTPGLLLQEYINKELITEDKRKINGG